MNRVLFALIVVLAAACASSHGNGHDANNNNTGGDGGNPNGYVCSSDLHDVLDPSGNVVMTCPDDQGCADGACVAACAAAAASKGSLGCDFVVATPSFYPASAPPCFAVFIANNWPENVAITVSRAGTTYDPTQFARIPDGTPQATSWPALPATGLPNASVAVMFMSHDPTAANVTIPMTCPVTPAVSATNGTAMYGAAVTGVGQAWHITTSFPVSAYDIMPYGGGNSALPSAELLLPTTAWGTNYIAVLPTPTSGPAWGQVVASQNGTTIKVQPTTSLPGGSGVVAAPAHAMTQYTLDAGEYIQWQDSGDMSGTVIDATAPVSFTGGSGYLCLTSATSTAGGCDSAHQQIPPLSALGSEYVAPPYATRRSDLQPESIRYRLLATVDGTVLTYGQPIAGAPTMLDAGQVADFETIGPFTITSQDVMHPFHVAQYMSGYRVTSGTRDAPMGFLGDEEFVNILPPAQWLSSYVFFTDPTYATTNLVIVRKASNAGFQDVTVDCLGTVSGWQPVAGSDMYQITNVDLQRGTPVGSCSNGLHTASSTGSFTIMVWGLDFAASYAYPAGGNVGKINPVQVIL